jgi:hypothetical protein
MSDKKTITSSGSIKLYTEFTKNSRDKIAELIEEKCKEHWLAPTVEGFVYGTTRALDFGDYWGTLNNKAAWEHSVNRNSDLFNYDELIDLDDSKSPRYLTFRQAAMHVNHNSHDPQLAIGLVFDAEMITANYNDSHIVVLFGIDKMKAPGIARRLETYPDRIFTSMGCSIKSSICTACNKQIFKDSELCNCLKYSRGGRVRGKKVAELLQKMAFYEQSIVTTPACPTAKVLDAVAEIIPGRILKVASPDNLSEADAILRIISSVNFSIKNASTIQEKKYLSNQFDALIHKLESMLSVA